MAYQRWYLDSRATHHINNSLQNLNLRNEYSGNQLLHVGNGQEFQTSHIGYACFNTSCDSILQLNDILFTPRSTKDLIKYFETI